MYLVNKWSDVADTNIWTTARLRLYSDGAYIGERILYIYLVYISRKKSSHHTFILNMNSLFFVNCRVWNCAAHHRSQWRNNDQTSSYLWDIRALNLKIISHKRIFYYTCTYICTYIYICIYMCIYIHTIPYTIDVNTIIRYSHKCNIREIPHRLIGGLRYSLINSLVDSLKTMICSKMLVFIMCSLI